MVREGRLSRFLALALVTVVIAVQGIAIGTAAFADYREKGETNSSLCRGTGRIPNLSASELQAR
ncbi:MAG: hypothetical protein ACOX3R_11045 [Desulfitobacteriia bacterium]